MMRKKRLGEILTEAQVISTAQLSLALERMKFTKMRLGEQLVKLKMCKEADIVSALSSQLRIPAIDLDSVEVDTVVLAAIPKSLALENTCFPFRVEGQYFHIAFADPLRLDLIQHLEAKIQRSIKKYIAAHSQVERAIEKHYVKDDAAEMVAGNIKDEGDVTVTAFEKDKEELLGEFETKSVEEDASQGGVSLLEQSNTPGTIKTVNQILKIAIHQGASDIHIEPQRKILFVRQRIDGILQEVVKLPISMAPAVSSRIKVLTGLDIAERRIPQDGKIRASLGNNRDVDLRVSTLPTKYGEKIVIRILDQSGGTLSMDKLFADPKQFEKVKGMIKVSQGMLLVTGPTGSGKTTTLYSIISELRKPETNIVTIEDPVEYELEGVNQVQVNHQIGLTFAKVLRSILRQDPEIILVGEIRDLETATVAFQAAATGHFVLSTLHTNSTYATITRLLEVGVEGPAIASTLQGILAQRLVRRLCKECKVKKTIDPERAHKYGLPLDSEIWDPCTPSEPGEKTCETCHSTGYKGRLSVVEVMSMSPQLRAAIAEGKPEHVIKDCAVRNGMELMHDVGLKFVLQGLTSFEELDRVLEVGEGAEEEDSLTSPPSAGDTNTGWDPFASTVTVPKLAPQPPVPAPAQRSAAPPPPPAAPTQPQSMPCPNCSETVKSNWKVCPFCGIKLEVVKPKPTHCPSCNEPVKPNWKMCPECGFDLSAPAPAQAASQPQQAEHSAATDTSQSGGRPSDMVSILGKPRVLVVDDQKSMQKLVTIALKGIDCEVATADDGVEALEKVTMFRPHLIILDIVMPKMDGLEVCRRLRTDLRTAFIPIMMLTSLSDEKSRLKGYVAGTDDYLAKPFVLEEFYTRVRNLLRRTYGYFTSEEDELLAAGQEWDAATEEARTHQRMMDRQSHLERLTRKAEDDDAEDGDYGSFPPIA